MMRSGRTPLAIRLLQLLLWAALIGPASLFAYAAWVKYESLTEVADERIERTLDVLQEHALRVFETIDRTIAETNEVLRGLSDEQIRADESRLHARLKATQQALPQVGSIWVFDRDGRPLVTSSLVPVPRDLNNADRDYFRTQAERDAGTYIGEVIRARIGHSVFFVVSRRRPAPDDVSTCCAFNGVVALTVPPTSLQDFYARIGRGTPVSAALIRADGAFLARYPVAGSEPLRLRAGNRFVEAIVDRPDQGLFTTVSQIDGLERRIGYRKLPGYPVYVQAGYETAALRRELRATMASHLVFGVPATLLLLLLSALALRRTRGLLAEAARREAAESALKQAQRLEAVGQLTGGVAHDFNNILMVVNGYVERLRRDLHDPRHRRALDAVDMAAARGRGLTRQLLTFSRRQTVSPVVIDLGEALPKLREMLRSSLRGDIELRLELAADLWRVEVDAGELELALLNLAVNARDAMPQGGTVVLAARNETLAGVPDNLRGEFMALSVRDTGTGIAPDVLPKIFEPFFTTKEVGKGTGLGLSQVYGFAKQAGGTVTVASEPGRGTELTLHLPRSRKRPPAADECGTATASGATTTSGPATASGAATAGGAATAAAVANPEAATILLVEDNAEIAEVTKANLSECGYRVLHVGDAQAALEAVERRDIDLVLSDVVMPGTMDGLDLAKRLRRLRPALPVVLTTGYSAAMRGAAPEGFTLLAKPYDFGVLQRTIREALERAASQAGSARTSAPKSMRSSAANVDGTPAS